MCNDHSIFTANTIGALPADEIGQLTHLRKMSCIGTFGDDKTKKITGSYVAAQINDIDDTIMVRFRLSPRFLEFSH